MINNITECIHHIVDIDECASNPCREDYGQCVDKVNKYECQCSLCNCTNSGVEQYVDCIFGKFCELAL